MKVYEVINILKKISPNCEVRIVSDDYPDGGCLTHIIERINEEDFFEDGKKGKHVLIRYEY